MTAPAETAVTAGAITSAARATQVAISAQAMRDAATVWQLLNPRRIKDTFPAWLRAMLLITRTYHAQSATAAGQFYRQAREHATQSLAQADLIQLAPAPDEQWLARAFGYSGPGMLSRDTARPNTALTTTLGTTSRIVMDGGRSTIFDTVQADPVAVGWYLQTDAKPCYWCAMIASRGIVFKRDSLNRSNAKFFGPGTAKLHNHCHCVLAPAFSHGHELPATNRHAQDVYYAATRGMRGPRNQKSVLPLFRKAWDEHLAQLPT